MNDTAQLLNISAFARRVGLAPSALRFYDDCRILRPARVDGVTGYRFYSPEQEDRARLLRSLRETGLPLAEIAVVLDGPDEVGRELLERHLGAVLDQTEAARAAIAAVLRGFTGGRPAGDTRVRVGGVELAGAVRQVVPAAAVDPEYPVLGCVLVEVDDGEVRLVATDRYRLSVRELKPLGMTGAPARVLVEAAELVELGRWAARSAEVTLEMGPDGFRVRGAAGVREPATFDGEFPMYREVLAAMAPPEHRVIVGRPALRDAVEALGETPAVTLDFSEDGVAVSAVDCDEVTALPAICQDELPPRIGFDPAVLVPVLETSVGPDVLLEIGTPGGPVLARSADQGGFTTLVMPVALEYVR
ncbi:MerR family transcriptional regulator [Streptomyces sp. ISL-11]|uniref:DNA polymerase III subunit beta family protein n=1 Tax=Streptomyces sp. ISL-11 TaxID=2819174 RepID=UPI001BE5366D|nr:MerR family transcriptional regulator [Streptomyces sp. ISL-11]MBT2386272.1 MerR family transcriptional regulator [Streptomyces sp. ISL-11]